MVNEIVNFDTLSTTNELIINKELPIVLIEKDAKIFVKDGLKAYILDKSNNANIEIEIGKDASLTYSSIESVNTKRNFKVAGELLYNQISLDSTNEEFNVDLISENASCDCKILALDFKGNSSYKQYVKHSKKSTFSNISNVGVVMNGSNILFDTTGYIVKGMSKSKCQQLSRGVVMDDNSAVTSKPILLIDEFDCFANHGACIGKMSDEDLFYLMSRGLNKNEAFLLILQGMIRPFVEGLYTEELQKEVNDKIQNMIVK